MATISASFNHGIASGDPYADSVILWTRVTPADGATNQIDVQWEIATSSDFQSNSIVNQGTFSTDASRDWTVKVEAVNLTANTSYFYRFRTGDTTSATGQTKTLPEGNGPVRLAVFSCANFTASEQFEAYSRAAAIHAANPYDALLHLGDYIYEYGPGGYGAAEDAANDRGFLPNREVVSLDDYRERYEQYHTDENLQAIRAAAPLIAIWDDHETANDSWKGGAENHQDALEGDWVARRDAALKAYYEWLPIREPNLRAGADQAEISTPLTQGYRSFNFGDVLALHVLETRLTARDEQLSYPDAASVQSRIAEILASPADAAAYASQLGLTPPASQEAIAAFGAALAPIVTQELVIATVQTAWGDPSRDLLGDAQLAWLQQQMATSPAAWQVLGQQVLMQSMAVPAELLLNAGDPSLLDKYAAPLQKLATGTAFSDLSTAEQALFAEAGKIPYNLDAWDGYGVERETILQTALAQNKQLISLAGDTHNAWAGVLDTMSAGPKPVGTVAGVEFATPGVTSPGLEKYLPGADAYIRANYPAVDGLDGLFKGYVNGLKYADLNRRGFLDLTVTAEEAQASFQLLNGFDAQTGASQWGSETVVATRDLNLTVSAESLPLITWEPAWRELDLVVGLAVEAAGSQTLLNPEAFASVPREGVRLADVTVQGSENSDRIFAGIGSLVDAANGNDELFNAESQGGNRLVGGRGSDSFYLNASNDLVIGGRLISDSSEPRFSGSRPNAAITDQALDQFFILSDQGGDPAKQVSILDFELGLDQIWLDGQRLSGNWEQVKADLSSAGAAVNAAPHLAATASPAVVPLIPGVSTLIASEPFGSDPDGDQLSLVVLRGPQWISNAGASITINAPADLKAEDLLTLDLELGLFDGRAITPFRPALVFQEPPSKPTGGASIAITTPSGEIQTFTLNPFGGQFKADTMVELKPTENQVDKTDAGYRAFVDKPGVALAPRALSFEANVRDELNGLSLGVSLLAFADSLPASSQRLSYYSIDDEGKVSPLTYNPLARSGARFYDNDGDGSADFVGLSLVDGGYGDKDGLVNGMIVDPSTFGSVDLNPELQLSPTGVLTAVDPNNTTAPASLILRASLERRPSTANQIGYVVLDENQMASTNALDLATIKQQSQILFSTLESADVVLPSSTSFNREILLLNGQQVRFFEVSDGTLDDLASANDARLRFLGGSLQDADSVTFASTSGVRFSLALLDSNQGLNALIGQEQGLAPVLDLTAFTLEQTLRGTLAIGREADFDSVTGFYRTLDAEGAVLAANGVDVLRPGDAGYAASALLQRVDAISGLTVADNQTSSRAIELRESTYLAPFAQVNGNTFFAFGAANTDGLNHFRVLGNNLFGLEDVLGGGDRDFDDLVIGFNFTQVV